MKKAKQTQKRFYGSKYILNEKYLDNKEKSY